MRRAETTLITIKQAVRTCRLRVGACRGGRSEAVAEGFESGLLHVTGQACLSRRSIHAMVDQPHLTRQC